MNELYFQTFRLLKKGGKKITKKGDGSKTWGFFANGDYKIRDAVKTWRFVYVYRVNKLLFQKFIPPLPIFIHKSSYPPRQSLDFLFFFREKLTFKRNINEARQDGSSHVMDLRTLNKLLVFTFTTSFSEDSKLLPKE